MSNTVANSYLHFIPAAIFLALPSTFIVTYFWSVREDHVYPLWPNPSETGALPPESCLFGMMLNLTAFTMLFAVYVRHKEVVEVFRAKNISTTNPNAFLMNKVSTLTGVVACGSLDVLANFQLATDIGYIHEVASIFCFYSSTLYIIQQAILSSWMVPEISGLWLVSVRWLLGGLAIVAVISDTVFSSIAYILNFEDGGQAFPAYINHSNPWTPDTPGYIWHTLSSGTQWIMVGTLGTFILTFYWDFRKITIIEPELEMKTEPVPQPVESLGFKLKGVE